MSKPILTLAAAASLVLASCFPPPPAPPPHFRPIPPHPPQPVDDYNRSSYDPYGQTSEPTPPPEQSLRPGEYPTARRSTNPNEVISPYEPYNLIDVEGFSSGQLARDPSNNKIFRVP